mgnify:CR=1 FL=1
MEVQQHINYVLIKRLDLFLLFLDLIKDKLCQFPICYL